MIESGYPQVFVFHILQISGCRVMMPRSEHRCDKPCAGVIVGRVIVGRIIVRKIIAGKTAPAVGGGR